MKHGMSKTKIYRTWGSMKGRCYCKTHTSYMKYGGKGVEVCEQWRNSKDGFIEFYYWAMDNGYHEDLTLDRIDSTKGYSPDNCRWATYLQQNTNLSLMLKNKSGYRGVHKLKRNGKFLANISINNKTFNIGTYSTLREAVDGRNNFIDINKLPHQKNIYNERT